MLGEARGIGASAVNHLIWALGPELRHSARTVCVLLTPEPPSKPLLFDFSKKVLIIYLFCALRGWGRWGSEEGCLPAKMHTHRSEANLWELILSFHHV